MRQVTVHFAMRVFTESGSLDLWRCERHRNDRGEGIAPQPEIYAVGCFFTKLNQLGSNFSFEFIVRFKREILSRRKETERSIERSRFGTLHQPPGVP